MSSIPIPIPTRFDSIRNNRYSAGDTLAIVYGFNNCLNSQWIVCETETTVSVKRDQNSVFRLRRNQSAERRKGKKGWNPIPWAAQLNSP